MESTQDITPRPLPTWLSIPIILLCLAGGGWIIHWYVVTDALAEEPKLLGEAPAPAAATPRGRGGLWNLLGASVRDLGNGRFSYRGNKATATVNLGNSKRAPMVIYNSYDFAPDMKTIRTARMLVEGHDKEKIAAMKVTDAQLNQLRGLTQTPEIPTTAEDKAALLAAFTAYRSATTDAQRQVEQGKIKQMVDDLAEKSTTATAAEVVDHAGKINAIITPEQWKLDADMGGGGN